MHFPSGAGEGAAEEAYARELHETLRAHRASGQRVALAPHWSDRSRLAYDGDAPFIASLPPELRGAARDLAGARMPPEAYLDAIRHLIGQLDGDPLLSAQFAIMAPQWASDGLVEAVGAAAEELAARVHLHALESPLQRAWGDASAGGRELERLTAARRARRPQRARPRRLAPRFRHRPARPHGRDRRAQLLLEPSPGNGRGAASPAAWRPG